MSMTFNKDSAEPGTNVTLTVKSNPGSVASICVIDQSVALLKETNELTDDVVKSLVDSLKLNSYYPSDIQEDNTEPEPENPENLTMEGDVTSEPKIVPQLQESTVYFNGYWENSQAQYDLRVLKSLLLI